MAEVVLADRWKGHEGGERVNLPDDEARMLINGGHALAATKPEAEKLGVDREDAATARRAR